MAELILWWLVIIPLAGNLVAETVTQEAIFDPLRTFIEVRTGSESFLTKLINCPVCVGYYTTTAISVGLGHAFFFEDAWPIPELSFSWKLAIFTVLTLASIRIAVILARSRI